MSSAWAVLHVVRCVTYLIISRSSKSPRLRSRSSEGTIEGSLPAEVIDETSDLIQRLEALRSRTIGTVTWRSRATNRRRWRLPVQSNCDYRKVYSKGAQQLTPVPAIFARLFHYGLCGEHTRRAVRAFLRATRPQERRIDR